MIAAFTVSCAACTVIGVYSGLKLGRLRTLNKLHKHARSQSARFWGGWWVPDGTTEPEKVAQFYYSMGASDCLEQIAEWTAKEAGREYNRVTAVELVGKGVEQGGAAVLANDLAEMQAHMQKSAVN